MILGTFLPMAEGRWFEPPVDPSADYLFTPLTPWYRLLTRSSGIPCRVQQTAIPQRGLPTNHRWSSSERWAGRLRRSYRHFSQLPTPFQHLMRMPGEIQGELLNGKAGLDEAPGTPLSGSGIHEPNSRRPERGAVREQVRGHIDGPPCSSSR